MARALGRSSKKLEFRDAGTHEGPLLVVEDLHTSFRTQRGTVRAVDGVSFEVLDVAAHGSRVDLEPLRELVATPARAALKET